METKYIILPYAMSSKSTKVLKEALGCNRIQTKKQTYQGYFNHIVINWGSQKTTIGYQGQALSRVKEVLNHPSKIINASNKLKSFKLLKEAEVPTLEWTTSRNEAYRWLQEDVVFSRTKLSANSGEGIIINKPEGEYIEKAPLYTKFFNKEREYRVHIFKDSKVCIKSRY